MLRFPPGRPLRPLVVAVVVFVLAAAAVAMMILRAEQHNREEERARISNVAGDHADALQRNIERAVSVTYALAALVRQGNGNISNFDAVGSEMLPFYPGVSSLSLAPGGVISGVVPLAGNEKAIGLDLLNDPKTKTEVATARNSGKLTLAGPLMVTHGEIAVIGRLPVLLDDAGGGRSFWGFVNAVIRLPDAFEAAGLPRLAERGIAYKLWRVHPDTGLEQVITASASAALVDPVEQYLELPYGNWTLSAAPVAGWGDPLGLSLKAALGLFFSLVLAYAAKLFVESRAHERRLEVLVAQRTADVHAREADLNRAQSVARVGSWVLDFTRNEIRGSNEALRIFGMSGGGPFNFDVFLGRVFPDDRNAVDRAWHAVRAGEPCDIDYRIMTGAAIRWVHSHAEPALDADGTRPRALGTVQDITERKHTESVLRESEARFRLTFELADSGIAHVHMVDGRFMRVNRSLCAIFGYSEQELIGRTVKELSHPEDRDLTDAARARVLSGELESTRFQKRYIRKDGAIVWVYVSVALVRDAEETPLYEIAVFDDITERKQAEQALRDSAQKLRLFADNVPVITVAWDENLRCRFANKVFAAIFGLAVEDVIGKHLRELYGEEVYQEVEGHFLRALQGHPVTYQRTHKLANGGFRYLEVKVLPHIGDQGKVLGCFAVTTDITEHKLAEERIQRLAHHDGLTGLPNRLLFNDRLNQAISLAKRNSRQIALLYLDLDKFKPVNDTLGHTAGDELLQSVAARIRQTVRESDTVARVGGDEFSVILPDIARREEAETVARKIIAALATPFQLCDRKQSVDIGTSIGIALYPADARDADGLVKAADAAMYSAKHVGNSYRSCSAEGKAKPA